ncbi:prenyltransferase/squalene oxidase repeat-containing protein [Planctomicrobium piriforme]|uniref:Squalene-hopene/tetraprenyl-beta-curcumene cyclase n=1 Tax=Planctomicrobium piriforme TaxID=1576369 RepID=A0A1I3HSF9_9PLAN|nr:prenyltransferase/squalene oxidase repeat-containing protein [Planctomicrobium piriforme]SFI38698.1 squalene-hopene/tetraprenyl-beta-curcumene cyclase [Planctomicrobium piriforme]
MTQLPAHERIERAWQTVRDELLSRRGAHKHWTGQLSTSALSTATAVMALEQVRRQSDPKTFAWQTLIDRGLQWLAAHQNADGGWGDTVKSISNISTTMLGHATFVAAGNPTRDGAVIERAACYVESAGGVPALVKRYGKDKTFSVPILTHCALAGLVDWQQVSPLPFELACIPARFYAAVQLPVVSYALPALIAIGQVRHHFQRPANSLLAAIRDSSIPRSLRVLERIQPATGGFLEATPLTSFVTMSLAAKGLAQHPVAVRGCQFIVASVLPDGSWPIDTNLATWVTTLSVNALQSDLPSGDRAPVLNWLLNQQYTQVHPFTNASPGGWAWTDLPGGVPDADDTPGALLALLQLSDSELDERTARALERGTEWLRDLQNRDGGWPTFCRGWGTLPFDRSSCDITAHCLRALHRIQSRMPLGNWFKKTMERGFRFLETQQQPDGSWLPLWFGNQYAPDDINPVYGTAKVLAAYRDVKSFSAPQAQSALHWLQSVQNEDGGWGGTRGCPSSVEETSLALEVLTDAAGAQASVARGLNWLVTAVEQGRIAEPAPIGFYFAKLWYFEDLYPWIFAASALRRCRAQSSAG